ncbi:helix-turn-helix domain-containing protein [Cohnella sp. GCM10020058]|uniref:AraC family transcriptional regulator n=1 Tax=Cohnella sp. GCM10020058 TaxID=3317330 RepID=UPI00363FBABF
MKIEQFDVAPYIRNADYAIRRPFFLGKRNLLDYVIFYVQEGTFEIELEGRVHALRPGDHCLLQPGDVHTIRGLDDTINPYVHLDFFYSSRRSQSFITLPGQIDMAPFAELMQPRLNACDAFDLPMKLAFKHPRRMRDLVMKMIDAWRLRTYAGTVQAQQLAYEWYAALVGEFMSSPQSASTDAKPLLNWMTSYFALHISDPITVKDMAKRAGLSPSRFNVVFAETFGATPYQYLLRMRIDHAKELLGNGYPIKVASEYCGFSDVHYFTKAFKSAVGVTPGQYREAGR